MPDAMRVANWRENTASARRLTLLKRWKMLSSFIASRFSEMSRTISPRWRSCSETTAFEEASISPRAGTPARSTARNAYALIPRQPPSLRGGRRNRGHRGPGEEALQLLRDRGALLGQRARDLAPPHQLGEMGVHGLHPECTRRLKRRVDLVGLALADQVPDRGRRHQHLGGRYPGRSVRRRKELLGDDPLESNRELHSYLLLLVRREDVDDPVHGLRGRLGVESGEHEVARLCRGQRSRDGLEVAHLADQDHVGVLAERRFQRG